MKTQNLIILAIALPLILNYSSCFAQDTLKVSGEITGTEIWNNIVHVTSSVTIGENAEVIVEPGTRILVKSDRDYKSFKKGAIFIDGGRMEAIGDSQNMIWFTSDHPDPINGDWGGIQISRDSTSVFKYCIFEFAELGIGQYHSKVDISYSIVRWNNSEGIYAENSTATFSFNRLYKNAYHEIALENNNVDMKILSNEFGPQNRPINFQTSDGLFRHNYVHDYTGEPVIEVTLGSTLVADSNLFLNCPRPIFVTEPDGQVDTTFGNDYTGAYVIPPDLGFPDTILHDPGYVPGDLNDRYPYVYDLEDETRKTVSRYGAGLGFGWAMCVADGAVWRHDTEYLYKIDTATGNYQQYPNDQTIQGPGGLTYDGTYFWSYDRNPPHHIHQFNLVNGAVNIISSFPAPESTIDRALGLTTDSTYLYQMSVNQPIIYKISKSGNVEGTITLSEQFADLVVWTGDGFIGTGGEYGWGKWSATGEYIGSAYPVAHGCWAMDFDGEFAWSMNKTCEIWNDAKIFKTKIKNWLNTTSVVKFDQEDWQPPTIYPVPVGNILNIRLNSDPRMTCRILSLDGKMVFPTRLIESQAGAFNLSHLPEGVYFIEFTSGSKRHLKRFIKL